MTDEELRLALLKADLMYKRARLFWGPWQALAVILIVAAALSAASRLAGHLWPPQPQDITIRLEQPIAIKIQP